MKSKYGRLANEIHFTDVAQQNIDYILLIFLLLPLHLLMRKVQDDTVVKNIPTIWALLHDSYFKTGSPGVSVILQYFFSKLPMGFFMVWNIFTFVLLYYSICRLCEWESIAKSDKLLIITWILLHPFQPFVTAGWITTCCIYLTPLSFAFFSLIYLRKQKKQNSKISFLLYWVALLIACSSLQLSLAFSGIYLLYLAIEFTLYKSIRKPKFFYCQLVTAFIFTTYHLTSPGNRGRYIQETISRFPDFGMQATLQKFTIGFTSTLGHWIGSKDFFFLGFCFILFIAVYFSCGDIAARLIAAVPLSMTIILGPFRNIFSAIMPFTVTLFNDGKTHHRPYLYLFRYPDIDLNTLNNYVPVIFSFLIVGCIVAIYVILLGFGSQFIVITTVFLVGLCTRLVLSFSPTIFASGTRTFIFSNFFLLLCSCLLYKAIEQTITRTGKKIIITIFLALASISYLENFSFVIMAWKDIIL
jgi:hypothetical protein